MPSWWIGLHGKGQYKGHTIMSSTVVVPVYEDTTVMYGVHFTEDLCNTAPLRP